LEIWEKQKYVLVNLSVLTVEKCGKVVGPGPIMSKNVNDVQLKSKHTIWKNFSNKFVRAVNIFGTGNLWEKVSNVKSATRQR
jgi:hypothetical protein